MAGGESESDKISAYIASLDSVAKDRYQQKLIVDGRPLPDPYSPSLKGWNESVKCWPLVHYGDIYSYLINTPGQYTQEKMKAFKSLDGYNYFISGHVQTCMFNGLTEDTSVSFLKAKVAPSQRANDKPHEPWVCVNKVNGSVVAAHCTCKAGLGEACSHIAALLFKIEAVSRFGLNAVAKTSIACTWNKTYRKKVTPQRIADIDFTKPRFGKNVKRKVNQAKRTELPGLTIDEQLRALKELKRICPTAGCLTKCESDTDSASEDEDLPPLMRRSCEVDQCTSQEELVVRCQEFVKDFTVSQTQADNLEKMTREQSECLLWQRHREGRITATIAHDVLTLRDKTPTEKLLKRIMRYEKTDLSRVEAVVFGRKFERKAKELYVVQMKKEHENFTVKESGLVVNVQCPLLAATPDGLRSCSCHGDGLLEVKCVYKHREMPVADIPELDSEFYLEKGSLTLKRSHRYFTQVQYQMHVCNKSFCDFVVYTHKGVHIQRININPEFVSVLVTKCTAFALDHLVPELVQQKFKN